jgi:hypothetical protein
MSSPGDFGLAADVTDLMRLVAGQHHDPHHLLGAHPERDGEGRDRAGAGVRESATGVAEIFDLDPERVREACVRDVLARIIGGAPT